MNMLTLRVLVSIGLMTSLSVYGANKEEPQINPNPQYFLTLKGYIAPELKGKVYLSFIQTYAALNNKCLRTTNWLEGVSGSPAKEDVYIPIPDSTGKYTLKIPLDRYVPGDCKWQSWNLGYSLSSTAVASLEGEGFITYGQQSKNNPQFFDLLCHNTPNDCQIKIPKGAYANFTIDPLRSYSMTFNLLYQEDTK